MAGIKGDFSRLRTVSEKIRSIGSGPGRTKLMKQIGATAISQVGLGFRRQMDPYDNPWRKLSASTIAARRKGAKKGGPRILENTGRLKGSFKPSPSKTGFIITTDVVYAAPHQDGYTVKVRSGKKLVKKKIGARMMVPAKKKGLGNRWNKAIESTVDSFIKKAAGK